MVIADDWGLADQHNGVSGLERTLHLRRVYNVNGCSDEELDANVVWASCRMHEVYGGVRSGDLNTQRHHIHNV